MVKTINLENTVPIRSQLDRVVDTQFNTFTNVSEEETDLSVDEFFVEYERLYYDIPVDGEFNSHSYLARRSSEISNYEQDTTNIQPLLDEIAQLRDRVLQLTAENIQLQIGNN
jgi:hypothetical protein